MEHFEMGWAVPFSSLLSGLLMLASFSSNPLRSVGSVQISRTRQDNTIRWGVRQNPSVLSTYGTVRTSFVKLVPGVAAKSIAQ